ncbi:MAG: NIPSNAP family protein [Thermomicrobiales bacterium]
MGDRATEHAGSARPEQPAPGCCPIVELRQYTLHPGQRDVLIDLFDREFVESQEAVGMEVIGQFRDLDDPNRFIWLRGFRDMPARAEALTAFYDGPVWAAHRDAANATMIDSDNVLLLRPARPASGFSLDGSDRPPPGAKEAPQGLVVATIYYLDAPADADFVDLFERELMPVMTETGAAMLASFVTESSTNTFPRLPVREGEQVVVWLSRFADGAAHEQSLAVLRRGGFSEIVARRLRGTEVRKLLPTARSKLHG